ncbi:hypothetical protein EIN_316850 [Entamoeba invadens IP1]|uniref:Uncharacterized protein n=1 Tax=Entamoeba invadens IP1 TaxID=370355 RepID=A0A0A1U5C2_ENTIV|nr:hypothetical protein EIN_316850 [Entamoeba invadens IP1]ELP86966.1 hypothetical protein EIN_316850 [Entamoeba invadens IP1]|eukprot:XP_004253737.1 hypothetical protein EIN_316850 [Entamoeba invadens IP1]
MATHNSALPPHPFAKAFPEKYAIELRNADIRNEQYEREQMMYQRMKEERYLLESRMAYLDIFPKCRGYQLPSLFNYQPTMDRAYETTKTLPSFGDYFGNDPVCAKPPTASEGKKDVGSSMTQIDMNQDEDTATEIASETVTEQLPVQESIVNTPQNANKTLSQEKEEKEQATGKRKKRAKGRKDTKRKNESKDKAEKPKRKKEQKEATKAVVGVEEGISQFSKDDMTLAELKTPVESEKSGAIEKDVKPHNEKGLDNTSGKVGQRKRKSARKDTL